MAFRNVSMHVKSAFSSILLNRMMSVASILTVACCLFLFGIFLLFTTNVNYLGDQVEAQCEIQAFIDITLSEEEARAIDLQVQSLPHVAKTTFETKEQAFENFKLRLEDRADMLTGLEGDNEFLRHSVKITLDRLENADTVAAELEGISGIAEIKTGRDIMDRVLSITNYIQNASFAIMIILSIVALFIISNTIKLSVNARANEIHIMKYVGATDWFIRWPFVIEGILVGIIGSILALIVLYFGYTSLHTSLKTYFDDIRLYSFGQISGLLISLTMGFGCLMGGIGSIISVRKHLKV